MPIRNEERFVSRTLKYLLEQDYPADRVEILVGVADSEDRTAEVVRELAAREPRIKYLQNPLGLSSGARTLGAQLATGEIVIYIDGHVYIDNNQLFRNTVRLMGEKRVAILSRPQFLDTPENTFFQRAVSLARKSPAGHGLDSTIYARSDRYVDPSSSGASYRKEVFQKVGYFDPSFDACEDVEFNYRCARAGFRSFTSMKLAVYYYPRSSLRALFRQLCRYGKGRFRLALKHPGTLSIGTLLPAVLTAGLPLLGMLGLVWPLPRLFFLAALAGYGNIIIVSSIVVAARNGWRYFPVLPGIYLAIHAGLGWGFLHEMFMAALRPASHKRKSPETDRGFEREP